MSDSNSFAQPSKRYRKSGENGVNNSTRNSVKLQQFIPVETRLMPSVTLSLLDKAAQLTLSDDQLTCFGCEGGFRMIRATNGVHKGSYIWEAEIMKPLDENCHVRLGWSSSKGELQAPVGYDQYSYAYRDISGARVHKSERIDDYGEPFTVGDVIGCLITLDENPIFNKISFFKNGKDQGIAYSGEEVPPGIYFPALSLYMQAVVRVNFGPTFIEKYEISGVQAISELQPMNPEDRQKHEKFVAEKRKERATLSLLQQQQKNSISAT